MKVIDLLNKIANGEIKEKIMFQYNNGYEEYANINTLFDRFTINEENLNTEIEIIEEDKKIEKLENKIDTTFENYNFSERMRLTEIVNKINEIIDYLEENKKC